VDDRVHGVLHDAVECLAALVLQGDTAAAGSWEVGRDLCDLWSAASRWSGGEMGGPHTKTRYVTFGLCSTTRRQPGPICESRDASRVSSPRLNFRKKHCSASNLSLQLEPVFKASQACSFACDSLLSRARVDGHGRILRSSVQGLLGTVFAV
jgi:hypothetical protein